MKKPDSVIFKRHLMKLSLEELIAYLKEYEKVRQVKVLDQINQMKQEEIQTKLEALSPVSACPSCNSNNFVKFFAVQQIGIGQSDIISITAVATIATASIMLTKVNAFFENLFCLYSP